MSLLAAVAPVAEHQPLTYVPYMIGGLAAVGALVALVRSARIGSTRQQVVMVAAGALRWVWVGSAVVLVVAAGLAAYGNKTDKWRAVPILSGSMSPDLDKGDVALVRPSTAQATEVGDVIIFKSPRTSGIVREGDPVIHRVIKIVDPLELKDTSPGAVYVETRGDNNPNPDEWIVELDDEIVWQQTDTVRDVGEGFLLIAQPRARFGLLMGAAILLAGTAISQFIAAGRRPDPEELSESDVSDGSDPDVPEPGVDSPDSPAELVDV